MVSLIDVACDILKLIKQKENIRFVKGIILLLTFQLYGLILSICSILAFTAKPTSLCETRLKFTLFVHIKIRPLNQISIQGFDHLADSCVFDKEKNPKIIIIKNTKTPGKPKSKK